MISFETIMKGGDDCEPLQLMSIDQLVTEWEEWHDACEETTNYRDRHQAIMAITEIERYLAKKGYW